jgi:hypothetical protein
LHSLRYGAAKLWNELPNDLHEGISLNNFKNLINKLFFIVIKSCKYTGVGLFIILKTSIAIKCNLLNLSEGNYDFSSKGLGAIRDKIGPASDVDKIFSKMYSRFNNYKEKFLLF